MALGHCGRAGLMVRDAPQATLLTMRVEDFAMEEDLILRSPPAAGVSKDGREGFSCRLSFKCDSPDVSRKGKFPMRLRFGSFIRL